MKNISSRKTTAAFSDSLTVACALIPLPMFMLLAVTPRAASCTEVLNTSVVFSKSAFLDVSKDQAQSIAALWTDRVASKWGSTSITRICNTLAELEKGIRSKKIDLVVLLSSEYLELRENSSLPCSGWTAW